MLYKKNLSKELSDELFKSPTSEYRGTPFWSWNCKMTPELVDKQIEYLKEMGFGGVHIHSRSGMDNPYLGEEFMSLVRRSTDKAKSEGMLAWLYDEDRWPSGGAGGLVSREPKYRARKLVFAPAFGVKDMSEYSGGDVLIDATEELPKTQAIAEGKPFFVGAYDVVLDKDGYLASYKRIKRNGRARGDKWYAYCITQPMSDWYNGYCYIDTLSPDAVKRFIEVTHERYKEYVGDEFGKTVPAIFTDEPQFTKKSTLERPTDKKACKLTWTPKLPESYKRAYGADILEGIPELFWDLPEGKASLTRYRYHDIVCEIFTNSFSKICGKWCDKNNLPLTGHMLDEPTLLSQTHSVGEAMRAYKYFGYPGIDMLCDRVELSTAKQTQSVVHQYGKEAMTSELYGVTNWDFDFRGHKFQGDWQAALGVTVRVPHLSWVSMKGDAKRDYPASINYQSPWYKEYPYIEDHFARVNTALTRGTPSVKIAVIHPIESYWLHWGPGATTEEKRNQLETDFHNLISWLLFNQLDFDFISESMLPDACKVGTNPLKMGKMKYDAVVVPGLETIRATTVERLAGFKKDGGHLIFMGDCPSYVDCGDNASVKALYEVSERVEYKKGAIVEVLSPERILEIRGQSGGYKDNYLYQLRTDGAVKWLFVANAVVPETRKISHNYLSRDCFGKEKLYFRIKGKHTPTLYDTLSGEIKDISFRVKDGYTSFELDAYFFDSFLIKLSKYTVSERAVPKDGKSEVIKRYDLFTKVKYEREEPNVLLLDIAQWKWDNESEYQPIEEMRRLDKKVRAKVGIPPKSGKQPWCLLEEITEHTVTMRFAFASEIDICGAEFACEDIEVTEISLDGAPVEKRITGYYTDESIGKTALPQIKAGEHYIEITKPLGQRTYNENCFLLGDFSVRQDGLTSTLIAPSDKIGFGSVTAQGMPFYGGNIKYTLEVDTPFDGCDLRIHASLYRGALISVDVDGECVGKIVYNPYTITAENVKKGAHKIDLTIFGNRHNTFGALHNCDTGFRWFGPNAFVTSGDSFSYEYRLKEMGILSSPVIEVLKKES